MNTPHPEMQEQLTRAVLEVAPELSIRFRAMFGGAGAYAYGQIFASLSNIGLALKLPADAQNKLLAEPGAKRLQYEPDSPPSKHYIVVPEAIRQDSKRFGKWVEQSLAYVATLPKKKG